MKNPTHTTTINRKEGSIMVYILVAMVLLAVIGGIASVVFTQTGITSRRADLTKAYQFADGGASIAANDLNRAFASNPNNIGKALLEDDNYPYEQDSKRSNDDTEYYVRTISAPFTNQQVTAEIQLTSSDTGDTARIVATATTGKVTQTATVNVMMSYGFGAAIISTAKGDDGSSASKSVAQDGNIAIDTDEAGKTYVDGGILANGSVNYTEDFTLTDDSQISEKQYDTEDQIPNYTDPGSSDQLFDFDRYIAASDKMGTHYANVAEFQAALAAAQTDTVDGVLEGVIVVDIYKTAEGKTNNGHGNNVDGVDSSNPGNSKTGQDTDPTIDDEKKSGKALRSRRGKKDKDKPTAEEVAAEAAKKAADDAKKAEEAAAKKAKDDAKKDKDKDKDKEPKGGVDWTDSNFPDGINIRGTLILNFSDEWSADEKMKILTTVNINPADLSDMEVGNADTYTTGYPATLDDSSRAAHNVDISEEGYDNFRESDDLPALMYRTAIADLHGNVNISGVVYSPVFAEIENKEEGQLQYFSGSIIVGGGIYYQNNKNAVSIISYEPTVLDRLATAGSNGKVFKVAHRE